MLNRVAGRGLRVVTVLCALTSALVSARDAHAFSVKQTSGGLPVHWAKTTVSFIVDDSIEAAVKGGSKSAVSAAQAWSAVAGAPSLKAAEGDCPSVPTVDGKNCIIFAPHGFLPAGNALAVTLVSFNPATGEIVDTDIVVNGTHKFAALAAGTSPPPGTAPVSTEGGYSTPSNAASSATQSTASDDVHTSTVVFDLQHVVAHEVGHALGLADSADSTAALMYPYTLPNDAAVRAPAIDDVDGIGSLYASSGRSAPSGGCGATVAGSPVGSQDAWAGLTFLATASLVLESRRRAGRRLGLKGSASRP